MAFLRSSYILIGFLLIMTPSALCGILFDVYIDTEDRLVKPDEYHNMMKIGFMMSTPISLPLGILGIVLVGRGVKGRCFRRSKDYI